MSHFASSAFAAPKTDKDAVIEPLRAHAPRPGGSQWQAKDCLTGTIGVFANQEGLRA